MGLSVLDQTIVNNLPQTGVSLIFGYGSKVIRQKGNQSASDQVDIIVAVDEPLKWHQENFSLNNQHYSFLKYLPNNIDTITKIQENYGAKIYYNTFVKLSNLSVKYGVIKTEHLVEDLVNWNELYVAGRLHKPVQFIVNTCDQNERLRFAMRFNKESALRAALLQLPEVFEPLQLYKTITGLSYGGDPRMLFGEDRNKINNIVLSQKDRFDQLYQPMIKLNHHFKETVQWNESKQTYTQDLSQSAVLRHLRLLPSNVHQSICQVHGSRARTKELDMVLASVSRSINCDKIIAHTVATIVRRSSLSQSFKGLITAGLVKSMKYSQRKLAKSLTSRLNLS